MEETSRRKYKLSHELTPSPTESDGKFFYTNLGYALSINNLDTKQTDYDDDNVFTPNVGSEIPAKPDRQRVESARGEGSGTQTKSGFSRCFVVILIIVLIIGLLSGVAVILAFYVFGVGDLSQVSTTKTSLVASTTPLPDLAMLEGQLSIYDDWNDDLLDDTSSLYTHTVSNVTGEMNKIMLNSNLSQIYLSTNIQGFSEGSVRVRFDMVFKHTYLSLVPGKEKLAVDVEYILKQDATAVDRISSLHINPGTVTVQVKDQSTTKASTKIPTTSPPTQSTTQRPTSTTPDITITTTVEVTTLKSTTAEITTASTTTASTTAESTTASTTTASTTAESTTASTTTAESTTASTTTAESTTASTTTASTTAESTTASTTTASTTAESTTASTTTASTTAESTTASTTTASTTAESTTASTTPPVQELCEDVRLTECVAMGINTTVFPNLLGITNQDEAISYYDAYLPSACSDNARHILCAVLFFKCDEGIPVYPCQNLCEAALADCGSNFPLITSELCQQLPTENCIPPLPPKEVSTTTSKPDLCEAVTVDACVTMGINSTVFPNLFGSMTQDAAVSVYDTYLSMACSDNARHILCAVVFFKCDRGIPVYPCRSLCEAALSDCGSDFPLLTAELCQNFPTANCVAPLPLTTTTTPSVTPSTEITTTAATTTTTPDLCKAVTVDACVTMGINSTVFPNMFGSMTQDAAVSVYDAYLSMACSDNARHVLCAMVFLKCDRGIPVYPCRSLCEGDIMTGATCGAGDAHSSGTPDLAFGFCEAALSDCGSDFPLVTAERCQNFPTANCVAPLRLTTTTTPSVTPSTEITTTAATTTTTPDLCEAVTVDACVTMGINSTVFPNMFGSMTQDAAVSVYDTYLSMACSDNARHILCAVVFFKCDRGIPVYPCRSLCEAALSDCGTEFPLVYTDLCQMLPTVDCVPPLPPKHTTTTPVVSTTAKIDLCEPVRVEACVTMGINATVFPNLYSAANQDEAIIQYETYLPYACSDNTRYILCASVFFKCNDTGFPVYPCRSLCEAALADCGDTFPLVSIALCEVLPTENCVPPLPAMSATTQATTQSTTTKATTQSTTPPTEACNPVQLDACKVLGFNNTMFPNILLENNQDTAIATYYRDFDVAVKSNCSDNIGRFVCAHLFPQCNITGSRLPCRHFCEAIAQECASDLPYPFQCQDYPQYTGMNSCLLPDFIAAECNIAEIPCLGESKCIPETSVCDGKTDCIGWSDERNCVCNDEYQYQCKMGMCIQSYERCDDVVQCPDGSDEENCVCQKGQHACDDGVCIMSEWVCDGEVDCHDRSDEVDCAKCDADQFSCLDGHCVESAERCNFHKFCPDQSDERDCLTRDQSGVLKVAYGNTHIPVCAESWLESFGHWTCDKLGDKSVVNTSQVAYTSSLFANINSINGTHGSYLGTVDIRSSCTNNQVVVINCVPRDCGRRHVVDGMVQYIVNGDQAAPGAWPWQGSLQLGDFGNHVCGASLIAPNFIVTATHCVIEFLDPSLMSVVLGITNRATGGVTKETYKIERIIKADNSYRRFGPGDITLFQLSHSVGYTPYIQPVCLPEEGEVFPETAICYTTGWGRTQPEGEYSTTLNELKMKLWTMNKCNGTYGWNGTIADTYMCAGYYSGIKSVCKGDSGGPLVCKDLQGTWKLVGVSSYVSSYCNWTARPNVFTDVRRFVKWIHNVTTPAFTCPNGKHLYQAEMLCNREDDCGDGSDERSGCAVSVNCTFDDSFLCGYEVDGFSWEHGNNQSQSPSYLPAVDHTVGRWPGRYLVGKNVDVVEGRVTSPLLTVSTPSCVRFHYNLRGQLTSGLVVRVYNHSDLADPKSRVHWPSGVGEFSDHWSTGHFDLSPGEYSLAFITTDVLRVAIDDIMVHTGKCSEAVCRTEEFSCNADPTKIGCVPLESKCNVIVDCPSIVAGGQDEGSTLCPDQSPATYTCNLDDKLRCGFQQDNGDSGEFLVVNRTYIDRVLFQRAFSDHTTGQRDGYMLFAFQTIFLKDNFVAMRHTLNLRSVDHCLTFHYRGETEAVFMVDAEYPDSSTINLWNFTTGRTFGWSKAQIQLPLVSVVTLRYRVAQIEERTGTYPTPYMALDDFTIIPGICPTYECLATWTKCASHNFCYPATASCDRKVDCVDESDETSCVCTDSEYRCSNGRCIPGTDKCNAVVDCLGGDDEASVCGPLRKVSCDFESPFLCGYRSDQVTGYMWLKHSGRTSSSYTGPSTDHSKGTSTGSYMYAEGNDGSKGDNCTLSSISITPQSSQSVEFFFHIYDNEFWVDIGGLEVVTLKVSSGEETRLWFHNVSTGNVWTRECVNLPQGHEIKVIFRAFRTTKASMYDADIALDDVTLQNQLCEDVPPTDSTPVPPSTTPQEGCAADQFRCGNGHCIPSTDRCDTVKDCLDNTDELNCP